jgi:hypothetical protein
MLKKFGIEDCKPVTTPVQTSCKLRKDNDSKSIDHRKYRSVIVSLLYVTTSGPYVMQVLTSEVTPRLLAGAEPDTHQFNVMIYKGMIKWR